MAEIQYLYYTVIFSYIIYYFITVIAVMMFREFYSIVVPNEISTYGCLLNRGFFTQDSKSLMSGDLLL